MNILPAQIVETDRSTALAHVLELRHGKSKGKSSLALTLDNDSELSKSQLNSLNRPYTTTIPDSEDIQCQ